LVENEAVLERARRLGRNVAKAMQAPADQAKWMGEEGTCPVCHLDLISIAKKNPVECPICGIRGELKIVGDEFKVTFTEEEMEHSRLRIGGLKDHWDELTAGGPEAMKRRMEEYQKRAGEITKKKEKYMGYREIGPQKQ
jgi:hypothetical protein